jgi:dethiobiotin synthetase
MQLPTLPKIKGVFITGTDTDVGKTWVAAGLTAALRRRGVGAVYFKPIQSGCPVEAGRLVPTDALFARDLAKLTEPLELLTPVSLRLPLAPGVAAAQEGVEIDLGPVAGAVSELARRYDWFVVEGAGGLYVPLIGTGFLVLDLIKWLGLPLLVVSRPGLGTINHTALTVAAARGAGIQVAGVVINRYPPKPTLAQQTNPGVIEAITQVPILALVPEVGNLADAAGRQAFLAALEPVAKKLALDIGRGDYEGLKG